MQKNQKKQTSQKLQTFLKFTGIGAQLGVTIYFSSLIGKKIDRSFNFQKPWATLFFIILSLVLFIINLMRQLNKLNND
ncbi:AtpZ/AtpI family protein [Ochrovirga pacifica]|uniref:AtpZ/AtpI family protein n=1 Tax=Ochrovirga pacifica TaxID=1042376 RepID=UPI0008FBC69A